MRLRGVAYNPKMANAKQTLGVLTTIGSLDEARALARTIVERKLAACAQVSVIESVYAWQGAIENDQEHRILFKTTADCYEPLEAAIRELHPYDVPAITGFEMSRVFEPYAEWVAENTRSSDL